MHDSYSRLTGMRNTLATLGKEYDIFTFKAFLTDNFTKQFFAMIRSINVCMIEGVDAELEAEVYSLFHGFQRAIAFVFPSVKSINCRRYFRAGITKIDLLHL